MIGLSGQEKYCWIGGGVTMSDTISKADIMRLRRELLALSKMLDERKEKRNDEARRNGDENSA